MENLNKLTWVQYSIIGIWVCNCVLGSMLAIREVWIPYMDAGSDAYSQIISDPFDGTTLPIAYIPDWTKIENQDKTKKFEEIPISDFLPLPLYDALELLDESNMSKAETILRYTYFTPYMGSYRLNYREHDGSHLGVDIRSPIGTPVLSIANGVVVRAVEADATGNKFVVIRHDNVPVNGKNITLYSCYLHLSQILATEGTKIRKGDILGRVGMTGIATTPHLHFQIDTNDAPFHPYWPFNSSDSRAEGLGFFESINAGLGRENAEKYSIHPMNFINTYLGGLNNQKTPTTINEIKGVAQVATNPTINIASYKSEDGFPCQKVRFADVSEKSNLGKLLYELVDKKCMFQDGGKFEPKKNLTKREAMMGIMDFLGIDPLNGTSQFLDIPIGDVFQGYALAAYRKGVLDGSYAFPDKVLSKEEFAHILSSLNSGNKNPSQMKVYNDVDAMNPNFGAIQNYAFSVGAKGGRFYPKNIMTKGVMVQMLYNMHRVKR